jgi:uncharacterized protein YbjT (DUF2867 family)
MGATIVLGDLKDSDSLMAACRGVQGVISTVSMALTAQPGDSFSTTDGEGTIKLVDAARTAGVGHFVFVSFDTSIVPDCPLISAKRAAEQHLTKSGITYSILHPTPFMENWLGPLLFADTTAGTAKVYGSGNNKVRYVARANVAELAVQCLESPAARNAIIPFGGPEGVSQREAVRIFEDVWGRPFAVTQVPEQVLETQWLSAREPFEKTFSALMLSMARREDSGMQLPYSNFPMEMVTVRAFVQEAARR